MRLNSKFPAALLTIAMPFSFAHSEGFKLHDLKSVEAKVAEAFGKKFSHWSETAAISVEGPNDQFVMLEIDQLCNETGQATRTDAEFFKDLDNTCTNKGVPCEIETLDVSPALGRLTKIQLAGGMKGANIIILKNGDRLTIRSAAKDAKVARRNAETAFDAVQDIIIGH